MFSCKNQYYLFIENTSDLDPLKIKIRGKFNIIYRNYNKPENLRNLKNFRRKCKSKNISFFISNNLSLLIKLKADGLYIPSFNKNLSLIKFKNKIKLIGSAHNVREIYEKNKQGCAVNIVSRLFKTQYQNKLSFFGVVKFNLLSSKYKRELVPLGGIRISNLNKLKTINSKEVSLMSEIKKKPANIINRLF